MSIQTAQQRIVNTLPELTIETIDNKSAVMIRPEGNLLVLERRRPEKTKEIFTFGLYVAKKILNNDTSRIYTDLDYIVEGIESAGMGSAFDEDIGVTFVEQAGFENGILEYRCEIYVTESKMPK